MSEYTSCPAALPYLPSCHIHTHVTCSTYVCHAYARATHARTYARGLVSSLHGAQLTAAALAGLHTRPAVAASQAAGYVKEMKQNKIYIDIFQSVIVHVSS